MKVQKTPQKIYKNPASEYTELRPKVNMNDSYLQNFGVYTSQTDSLYCLNPFKDEAQTALFKDPVRTAL
jgi:hypothetical protein